MSDQTYMASHDDCCTPLSDKRDVLHLIEGLLEIGCDRITILTADNKTVTIEPALHLALDDFIKAMADE